MSRRKPSRLSLLRPEAGCLTALCRAVTLSSVSSIRPWYAAQAWKPRQALSRGPSPKIPRLNLPIDIDAKIVRFYGAGALLCLVVAANKMLSQSTCCDFRAILILAVPHITENPQAIASVMAGFLALCANVVGAVVTAAGLVAKKMLHDEHTGASSCSLSTSSFLTAGITAVIVLIARKPLTKHSTLRTVSQHNTLVIFAFVFHVRCDGSMFTSALSSWPSTLIGSIIVRILIVSIMHRFKLPIRVGIILNGANIFLSAFSSGVSDLFALATLAERARAKLLSMTGCFAHRAVIWALPLPVRCVS